MEVLIDQTTEKMDLYTVCKYFVIRNSPLGSKIVCTCEEDVFDEIEGCKNCPHNIDEREKHAVKLRKKMIKDEFSRKFCPLTGLERHCVTDSCVCFTDTGNTYKCSMTGAERAFKKEV